MVTVSLEKRREEKRKERVSERKKNSPSLSSSPKKPKNPKQVQGKSTPTVKNILTLDTCAPIAGAEVMSFKDEASLLRRWRYESFEFLEFF